MKMPNQSQFKNFLKDIEPSPTTKKRAKEAHTNLRKFIREHEIFKDVHLDTFLSGSYKRDTAIRPAIKDGKEMKPDIDIIVVTNHTLQDEPSDVLKLLRDTLKDNKSYKLRTQSRSVGVSTETVDMDVVPIIAPQGMEETLYIPDRKLETWLETNPPKHTTWTTEVNEASGGQFKPLVKLMKWWRRDNPTISKRPKGFVIECITAECMDYEETQYDELFLGVLEGIVNNYAWAITLGKVPRIADPGVPSNSVTNGITFPAFEGFYNKAKDHAEIGRNAQEKEEEDPDKALEMWRQIFGPRFPAHGKTSTSESLLRTPVTPQGLTFPNKPVIPREPGGFAY